MRTKIPIAILAMIFTSILIGVLTYIVARNIVVWKIGLIMTALFICFFFISLSSVSRKFHVTIFSLISLFAYFFLIILLFGQIYQNIGGIVDDSGNSVTDTFTCIYFSIVTFTTLGYGDLHPVGTARAIAAAEALLGYMCMGLLIGVIVFLLTRRYFEREHLYDF